MTTPLSAPRSPSAGVRLAPLALLSLAALGALAIGCHPKQQPPPVTAAGVDTASSGTPTATLARAAGAPAKKPDTASPTSGSVQIEDRILKACGDLPTARFAFDSAKIDADAARPLDALARCFVSGPLAGKGMRLVGHADPRGETEYNLGLGQRRAGSVADYLSTKGLEKGRIKTLSKGDLEATGTDDEGWARDRKVEVFLND